MATIVESIKSKTLSFIEHLKDRFLFPTMIYTTAWEDFDMDMQIMNYKPGDIVLTLTGGGCNALNVLCQGSHVNCVDMNKHQNMLMKLKLACIMNSYETLWKAFGDGCECKLDTLEISDSTRTFFSKKDYFTKKRTIYTHGGMGIAVRLLKLFNWRFQSITEQKEFVSFCFNILNASTFFLNIIFSVMDFFSLTNVILWYISGVPKRQIDLITERDERSIIEYLKHVANVFCEIKLDNNHYYYLVTHGKYTKDCCPLYLKEENYETLIKSVSQGSIEIKDGTFLESLQQKLYSKVILMDHMDWNDVLYNTNLARALSINCSDMILLRSASVFPPYIEILTNYGFLMECINSHCTHNVCDKVNTYASTWVGYRKAN